MDQLPEIYTIETIEQLRTFADELRMRIVDTLTTQAMTAKQIASFLHEPPAKTHYHVRELERVGLITLVETREKGGILEKYYRAVAKEFTVPRTLLQGLSPDERTAEFRRILTTVTEGFLRTFALTKPGMNLTSISVQSLLLTDEEFTEIAKRIGAAIAPYADRQSGEGNRQEYTLASILYRATPSASKEETMSQPTDPYDRE